MKYRCKICGQTFSDTMFETAGTVARNHCKFRHPGASEGQILEPVGTDFY